MKERPDIFLIVTDQHRADAAPGSAAKKVPETPALDQLAADGTCFTEAYTSCPICTPARSSIHTGLYPSVTGMCTNLYRPGSQTHELPDRPFLLSRKLEKAGYACGLTGKWHLGIGKDKTASAEGRSVLKMMENGNLAVDAYKNFGTLPTDIGFYGDDFPGHGDGGWEMPQYREYLKENGLKLEMKELYKPGLPLYHSKGAIITSGIESTVEHFLVNRAIEITKKLKQSGAPIFLNLNFWGPHEPYFVPEEYYEKYRSRHFEPWASYSAATATKEHEILRRPLQDWSFFEENLRHYYAYIEFIDSEIGRFFSYLKEAGLYDDSVILFTADHGDSQGCHGGMENKAYHMFEETAKIPMILKTGQDGSGGICEDFVGTCDIYATVLHAAGLEKQQNSGYSMLPAALGVPDRRIRRGIMTEDVGVFPLLATQRMYREGSFKYVFNFGGTDELYNLSEDPHELNNLIDSSEHQELLTTLRNHAYETMKEHQDPAANGFAKLFLLDRYALIP